jgi:hypothetical protein
MAKTRQRNPRTVMRYVKPGTEAVAEITQLLEPPDAAGVVRIIKMVAAADRCARLNPPSQSPALCMTGLAFGETAVRSTVGVVVRRVVANDPVEEWDGDREGT